MRLEPRAESLAHDVVIDRISERSDRGAARKVAVSIVKSFEKERPPP